MRFEKTQGRPSAFIILFLAAVIALTYGCKVKEAEKRQAKTKPDVTVQNGVTALTLEKAAQEKAGIAVASLKTALHRQELQAYGTVLQPGPLIDIRNNYTAEKASADKAASALEASRKGYERLKKLNESNQNISDKSLQAAGAVLSSDQADLSASREKLQAVRQTAMAQWGKVISEWVFSSSPEFNRLVSLKDVLIRVTLPSDKFMTTAPETVRIQAPGLTSIQAKFICRAPNTDPRIQGTSFLYLAPTHATGLMPGLSVQSSMPFGPNIRGAIIPLSAVIWLQGKAWAYVQTDPEHFSRREVPTVASMQDGYFIPESFKPGEMVVIRGAQTLLSRELLPSKPAGGEEEED